MLAAAHRPLVCLHYGIGDVVMQLPALDALRAFLPRARVTLLGASPALELLHDDPRWQDVRAIQSWGLTHWGDEGSETVRYRIRRWFERLRFDVVLDGRHAVKAVGDVLGTLPVPLLDADIDAYAGRMNGAEALMQAVRHGWGLPVPSGARPSIRYDAGRREAAEAYLRSRYWDGRPLVALTAVTSSALKRWPPERMAAVGDALADRFDLQVAVFAGHQNRMASRLVSHLRGGRQAIVIEALHLLDTAALLACCRLLIANDTGLMHMAAAVGTRVVALFGPTAERIYLPPSAVARGVSSPVPCPYRKTTTFGPSACLLQGRCMIGPDSCIERIPTESVLQAAEEIMTAATHGGDHDIG